MKYFADMNFRELRTSEFFTGQKFADLTKICESFYLRKCVRLKLLMSTTSFFGFFFVFFFKNEFCFFNTTGI